MAAKQIQSYVQRDREASERELVELPDGQGRKLIVLVQTCSRCGRSFTVDRKHQRCPRCQGTLTKKVMVLKVK
jgi:predicted Zn-ribbon and HTH transcriptional regulator